MHRKSKIQNAVALAGLLSALAIPAQAATREYPGFLTFEAWNNLLGADQAAITDNLGSLATPAEFTGYMSSFNTRTVYGDDSHNDYLARISGWFVPTQSGNYTFHVRSDDASQVFISSNATLPDPTTATPSAMESTCCGAFETTGETVTAPIAMVAGQKYGVVVLLKEGGGGDWLELAARLEGDTTALAPIAGSFLATTAPDLTIVTQPVNFNGPENFATTTSVEAGNVPGVTYQWETAPAGSSTFTAVAGQTSRTLTVTPTLADNNRQYRVVVSAPGGQSITSSIATLTVAGDTTAPTIESANTFVDRTGVLVRFSEAMAAGYELASSYGLSPTATISSVDVVNDRTVFLRTAAPLTASTSYTLTATGLKDKATTPNALTPNTATFTSSAAPEAGAVWKPGQVVHERFTNIRIEDLADSIDQGTAEAPSLRQILNAYEAPVNVADNYTGRISGYFIPPSTGDYVFHMASDDRGLLYLSTDSDRLNRKAIAHEPTWNDNRDWSTLDRRNAAAPENRSDTWLDTQWPSGNTISLVGGQKYWLELYWTEGGGGDNGGATFRLANETAPADQAATRLTGDTVIGSYIVESTQPPTITQRPRSVELFYPGDTISFSVTATGPGTLTYQWYRSKMPIPGATSATLTIPNADATAVGDYYVDVTNENGTASSFPDNDVRAIMAGAFVIEAEDFNYEGGQHLASSDTMPFVAGEYRSRPAVLDVDFWHNFDTGDAGAFAYTRFPNDGSNAIPIKGHEAGDIDRGSFNVSPNYAIGWSDDGEWMNYTRHIPTGKYMILAGVSYDGRSADQINMALSKVANPTVPDGSDIGVEGGAQGLTPLGTFQSAATGGWSNNDIVPLRDEAGNVAQVQLGGETTLRLTFKKADGDFDYLLLYCVDCPAPKKVSPFIIEAEDFNYNSGQTKAEASVMPLAVNLYNGLAAVAGVDYNDPGNEQDPGAQAYRVGEVPNVALTGTGDNDRISFDFPTNYRIGWVGNGDWYNYTRTFPAGNYNVYAALSQGDQGPTSGKLDLVTNPTVAEQTLTELGTFMHEGQSGGWGVNQYVPLKDAQGNIAKVSLSGTQTVRFTGNSGDFDFLIFMPDGTVVDPLPQITAITRAGGQVTITWTGGGTLETAASLPAGANGWTSTGDSDGSYTTAATAGQAYFRVRK